LVDHPVPEEVEVQLPPLPQGLILDRARTETRLRPSGKAEGEGDTRRWTALQYRFLARTAGAFTLNPLQVVVGDLSARSSAFSVTVRNPAPQSEPVRLFWQDPPAELVAGEEALLALCIAGQNPPELPAAGPPLPPVPPMAIMEAVPARKAGEVLALRIIPLEGPFFVLPGFSFPLETGALQVPALRIPVKPAAPAAPGPGLPENPPAPEPEPPAVSPVTGGTLPPFPSSPVGIGGRKVRDRSRALWEEGQAVEALAELRRNERDHPAGFTLKRQRRELDKALGLEQTVDELFRPPLLLVPVLVLSLVLAALGLTIPGTLLRSRKIRAGDSRAPAALAALNWGFRAAGLAFTLIALFCLLRLTAVLPQAPLSYWKAGRQALARDAVVYRAPEDTGTEITRFREGQGLLVYELQGGWAYAESVADRRTGWIRAGTYLIY
jgi:hypothetical protein